MSEILTVSIYPLSFAATSVDAGLLAVLMNVIAKLRYYVQPVDGLSVSAEYHFFGGVDIGKRVDDVLRRRLLRKPESVLLVTVVTAYAEVAVVGTAVGEIEINLISDFISIGIHKSIFRISF